MTGQAENAIIEFGATIEKNVAEIVNEIDKVRDMLYDGKRWTPTDGELMSQAIVKLAALNSSLGEHVATAEYDANTVDAVYRHTRESIKLQSMNEKKTTASEAESIKIVETEDMLEKYNKAAYVHKLLQNKRKDTSEFIDALRSRLSFMKIEMSESRNV